MCRHTNPLYQFHGGTESACQRSVLANCIRTPDTFSALISTSLSATQEIHRAWQTNDMLPCVTDFWCCVLVLVNSNADTAHAGCLLHRWLHDSPAFHRSHTLRMNTERSGVNTEYVPERTERLVLACKAACG